MATPSAPSERGLPDGVRRLADGGPDASVALWWLDTSRPHQPLLDAADEDRVAQLSDERSRRRTATARSLVRVVVASVLGVDTDDVVIDRRCPRCGAAHGPPRIVAPDSSWHLSASTAGTGGLLAMTAAGPVGVDVERLRPVRAARRRADQVLVGAEPRAVASAEPDRAGDALLGQWVRKEAVVKATGLGLPAGLRRYEVLDDDDPWHRVADRAAAPGPAPGWWLEGATVPAGWVAALAVRVPHRAHYSPATSGDHPGGEDA